MQDNRKYDRTLVDAIRQRQYVREVEGMDVLFKAVPDDDRAHAMDPRLFDIAARKKAMFSQRKAGGWRLSNERFRPDKVTYDLTEAPIVDGEFLIDVDGNHMIDVFSFRREDDADQVVPALVYCHGGGFTAGDIHLFEKQMAFIAEQAHAAVFFPEYRLAPETPFPGAIRDVHAAVEYVFDHAKELCVDPDRIMVAGDSAGGSLTNACVLLDERGIIKEAFELYPGIDMRPVADRNAYGWSYDAYPHLDEQDGIVRDRIDRIRLGVEGDGGAPNLYLQGHDSNDPLVSVAVATDEQLARFPKIVINNAEFDYLRLDAEAFARRLKDLGVDVRLVTYCGCDHGFLDLMGTVIQSEEIALCIAEELKAL